LRGSPWPPPPAVRIIRVSPASRMAASFDLRRICSPLFRTIRYSEGCPGSPPFYEFIKDHVQFRRSHLSHHHTKILLRTERWTKELALGFIGGPIDSDGHVVSTPSGRHYGVIVITSSSSLKRQLCNLCNALCINVTTRVQARDPFQGRSLHSVYIRSADFHALCGTLPSVKHSRFHGGPGRT